MIHSKNIYRWLAFMSVVLVFSLACGLTGTLDQMQQAKEAIETVQNAATQLDESGILQTGQAVATQIDESGVKETALALATQLEESGVKETALSLATQFDESGAQETLAALATQAAESGVQETAQALITQVDQSGLQLTADALSAGQAPPDIPVMDGTKEGFVATDNFVTYVITEDFQKVVDYYLDMMPARGWVRAGAGDVGTETTAELVYQKPGRSATIVIAEIPFLGQVSVIITIE